LAGSNLSASNKKLVGECVKLANQRFGLEYSLRIICDEFNLDSVLLIKLAKNREIKKLTKVIKGEGHD